MKTGFFRQAKDLKITKEKIQAMLYVRQCAVDLRLCP
jgi:hypothetical protein